MPSKLKYQDVQHALRQAADPQVAKQQARFFKTGMGEYAQGDVFIGVRVPHIRKLVGTFKELALPQTLGLLSSPIHEERLFALLLMVAQYQKGSDRLRVQLHNAYKKNMDAVNNWDLVDSSAPMLMGEHLLSRSDGLLFRLAGDKKLFYRRIAVLAQFAFIKQGQLQGMLRMARMLLTDKEDLIQKAVGWMLRELGKRDEQSLKIFIKQHVQRMPRTMLRYAIEKWPEKRRKAILML